MEQLKPAFDALIGAFSAFDKQIVSAIRYVEKLPPSPGYEQYLVEDRVDPILARGMSYLVVRRGRRVAMESARLKEVVSAIRFLSAPGRKKQAISNKVSVLLGALEQTAVFEKISRDTGLELSEFILSLKAAAEGREDAYHRLTKSAASVAPYLTIRRGPKVRAQSVAHEFFLEVLHKRGKPCSFTWQDAKGTFTDPRTEATRREFGLSRFNPRSAHSRWSAGKSKKTVDVTHCVAQNIELTS
jgi:hypothetical protein